MKMMIDIDDDTLNDIVKNALIGDYKNILKEIEYLRSLGDRRSDSLSFELHFNEQIRDAMKVIFEYYLSERERDEVLK